MEFGFLILLLCIAYLYSSVGHGGASGYLALMALYGFDPATMQSSALTLNLFVSSIAFFAFYKGGYFRWKVLLPFVISSMPMAFIGARMPIEPGTYKIILGICLLIAILRLLISFRADFECSKPPPFILAVSIGAFLGFFSGMIGIGGGIILSPLLLIFHWTTVKETAAISAAFIFLNSASGLIGLSLTGIAYPPQMAAWIIIVVTGSLAGSYIGSYRLESKVLRNLLATVLLVASVKLILT
jgi:uncharacterized membrane protein YfcA